MLGSRLDVCCIAGKALLFPDTRGSLVSQTRRREATHLRQNGVTIRIINPRPVSESPATLSDFGIVYAFWLSLMGIVGSRDHAGGMIMIRDENKFYND